MPTGDWQFWIVTLIAAAGAWLIMRTVWPRRDASGCAHCASGSAAAVKKRSTNVTLTVASRRI